MRKWHEKVSMGLVGSKVKNLKAGDGMLPYPMDYCGKCSSYTTGNAQFCPEKRQFGVLMVDGVLSEYLYVPAKVCYTLHDDVLFSAGSRVGPLAVGFRAVKHAGGLAAKIILAVRSGTIGLRIVACAKIQSPSSAGKYR